MLLAGGLARFCRSERRPRESTAIWADEGAQDRYPECVTPNDAALVLIPALAVVAPLLARMLRPLLRVPIVVFELLLGILVGPAVLGWIAPHDVIDTLADFGLAMLFFIAGTEIVFAGIRRATLARASLGWLLSLAAGIGIGLFFAPGEGMVVVGIALSSTALGTLLPILRDTGDLPTPFGVAVTAIGAVGEFLPLVAISIFLSTRTTLTAALVLVGFVVLSIVAIVIARRAPHGQLHGIVRATLHTSEQFGVRFVLMLIAALVVLSLVLDLDMLLGAFVAGIVWRLVMARAPEADGEAIESKVEAIAFGFLVPIFFLTTGVNFDLDALVSDPAVLALVPIFLVALLVIRGAAAQLSAPTGSSVRDRGALGLFAATGLPIIVAVTAIGVEQQMLDSGVAAALVGAGMLSVLLFPVLAMSLRGERVPAAVPQGEL